MRLPRPPGWLRRWFHPEARPETLPADIAPGPRREAADHVIILDGTLSGLDEVSISSAGLTFRLLAEGGMRPGRTLYYEEGLQWRGWRHGIDLLEGRGIEEQIARAYGHLASHYRPGDRIFLMGYSRGAFAVRSLAGMIDRVGLLRHDAATERHVRQIWRHYRMDPHGAAAQGFARLHCHEQVPIRMVGVWETVKALGMRLPLLWLLTESQHAFHSTHLGESIEHGFQALALDETRVAFAPLLWTVTPQTRARVEQVWFRGAHGDIGGQIGRFDEARRLANIPLVWMLDRAEACGLDLPPGWRMRFPCDPGAPMVGTWRGFGAMFLLRARRRPGHDPSERLHESVPDPVRSHWLATRRPAE